MYSFGIQMPFFVSPKKSIVGLNVRETEPFVAVALAERVIWLLLSIDAIVVPSGITEVVDELTAIPTFKVAVLEMPVTVALPDVVAAVNIGESTKLTSATYPSSDLVDIALSKLRPMR